MEDLANQVEIKYGCMGGGSTSNFFKVKTLLFVMNLNSKNVFHQSAKDGIFHTMWNFMDANPDVFTDSNSEGIERVQESGGKYAFFMESASIEYIMERHCELARVGRELDAKGYGIGEETFLPPVEITTIHPILSQRKLQWLSKNTQQQ